MRKFLIVTAFALATPAMAHDCPDKVIAAADHLGLNRVESFGATHPTYYLPAGLDFNPSGKTMNKEKSQEDEFGAIGKQTMARAYSAMDYYFDHLKKNIASAPTGG